MYITPHLNISYILASLVIHRIKLLIILLFLFSLHLKIFSKLVNITDLFKIIIFNFRITQPCVIESAEALFF